MGDNGPGWKSFQITNSNDYKVDVGDSIIKTVILSIFLHYMLVHKIGQC